MLDLLLAADKAAKTSNQHDILHALMEDDERGVRRIMERDNHHEILFEDSFFVPFMGLAAAHGSREVWRTLRDWGYSMQSKIRNEEDYERGNEQDLGSWVCQFLPLDRLTYLTEWKILLPFGQPSGKSGMTAGEYGMLGGSNEHFDFWLDQWKQSLQEKRKTTAPTLPRILETISGMLRWEKEPTANPYPDNLPSGKELRRRADGIIDVFASIHYGASDNRQEQWVAMVNNPPRSSKSVPMSVFIDSLSKRTNDPWSDTGLLEKAMDNQDPHFLSALLESGIPLNTPYAAKLPVQILKWVLDTTESNAGPWHAWCDRARTDHPERLANLPKQLTAAHCNVRSQFVENKAKRKATLQAIELALTTDNATAPKRSGPRL